MYVVIHFMKFASLCIVNIVGPGLLFQKFNDGKGSGEKFYSCSAFRDRKKCRFMMPYNKTVSELSKPILHNIYKSKEILSYHNRYVST